MEANLNEIIINGISYIRKDRVENIPAKLDGKTYCIIRTYSAGVFAGFINRTDALNSPYQSATIYNSRRIHWWEGAASISQVSQEGFKKLDACRIAMVVPEEDLRRIIEVIPCTEVAKNQIEGAKEWKK